MSEASGLKFEYEPFALQLTNPFRISSGTQLRTEGVWVRLTAGPVTGWGEAIPTTFSDDRFEDVLEGVARAQTLLEGSRQPDALESIDERMVGCVASPAARSGVMAALYDLVGKQLGTPTWRLLGLDRDKLPLSSMTVGIDHPELIPDLLRAVEAFPVLKVKLGHDEDECTARLVREHAPDKRLIADANGGWSLERAMKMVVVMRDLEYEMVEQPLQIADTDGYRALRQMSPIPIFLDEGVNTAADLPRLGAIADGVNIKLSKAGGLREALRMVNVARALDLQVMLGCNVDTTLGIAPAAHMAPLADYADLDGALFLESDRFNGPHVDAGRIVLSDEPGLGVAPSATVSGSAQ